MTDPKNEPTGEHQEAAREVLRGFYGTPLEPDELALANAFAFALADESARAEQRGAEREREACWNQLFDAGHAEASYLIRSRGPAPERPFVVFKWLWPAPVDPVREAAKALLYFYGGGRPRYISAELGALIDALAAALEAK